MTHHLEQNTQIFQTVESNVRSYCRSFPVVFDRAKNARLFAENGDTYIDFFAGAGALNYGHNPNFIKEGLLEYISDDRILHGLDLFTSVKREFLTTFKKRVLDRKNLDYKVQFPGPTGTNAVEAATKIARKVKQRTGIFAFMGGYHGMTLGALAATGNKGHRQGAGVPLGGVTFMPYPYGFMSSFDTITYIEEVLCRDNSGIEKPSAILLETVQAEGGIIVADTLWLQRLRELCDRHDILMIVDDIQVGCGRVGPFFSFERASIQPDIVTLSKSISGCGLPLSMVLMKPDLDEWQPAEHNGTFRGNQLAFVAGEAALKLRDKLDLENQTLAKGAWVEDFLNTHIKPLHPGISIRGLGLIWGIDFSGVGNAGLAGKVTQISFQNKLIVERAGSGDQVIKLLPPLTIEQNLLEEGCQILFDAIKKCF